MIARLLLAGALIAGAGPALAVPVELRGLVQATKPAGCSDVTFLVWDFYRAELWSDSSTLPGKHYGLALTYHTDFSRQKLVDSSIEEMARISGRPETDFLGVQAELDKAFRDVSKGDRITAWRAGPNDMRLFYNGAPTGTLTKDVDLFMDIWLGSKTRDDGMRAALLSGKCDG